MRKRKFLRTETCWWNSRRSCPLVWKIRHPPPAAPRAPAATLLLNPAVLPEGAVPWARAAVPARAQTGNLAAPPASLPAQVPLRAAIRPWWAEASSNMQQQWRIKKYGKGNSCAYLSVTAGLWNRHGKWLLWDLQGEFKELPNSNGEKHKVLKITKNKNISVLLFQTKYSNSEHNVTTLSLGIKIMKGKRVSRRLAAAIQLNEALLEMQVVIASLFEEHSWGMCIRGLIVRGRRLVV